MGRLLERFLNLRRGDIGRGSLLFTYLLLVMASYVIGKSARAGLFLNQFKASKLPYADITIALLVGFVAAGYVFLARRISLRNLQLGTLVFFASNCALFWYLAVIPARPAWLYPVFYIWVGVLGVVAPAQVWTIANFVLTTREAKRVFGLLGSGAIVGGIAAGLITNIVAKWYHTETLLLVMTFFLALSGVLVLLIWRQKLATPLESLADESGDKEEESINLRESLKHIFSSHYLLAICGVISMCSVVTATARWQFVAISSQYIPGKDALTAFLGAFDFYAGLAGLITQLLFTGRFLRRFGIGLGLFVLPIWLLLGTAGVIVWGTLVAVSALRGGDQLLRYSIDKSSVELLFLPIPQNIKVQVKSCIDTVIWRLGDGLSGVAIAVFADQLKWTAQNIGWINIMFVGGWLVGAFAARRHYVATLKDSIQQHRLDAERASAPVLDRTATEMLVANLSAVDPQDILYGLSLFEVAQRQAAHPAVRGLLSHPSPEVRQKAISILSEAGDKSVEAPMYVLLHDPSLEVRTEALLYLTHHAHVDPLDRIQELGDFPDFSIRSAMVAFLARPGESQNLEAARVMLKTMVEESGPAGQRTRLEAARLLGTLPDLFDEPLRILLADEDKEVVRQAFRAVGQLRKRRFVLRVLDRLSDPSLSGDAAETLLKFGERVVGTLADHLNDPSVPLEVRRELPGVMMRIGSTLAVRSLMDELLTGDTLLRFRVIAALNKLLQIHPEITLEPQMIETVLAAEIMGHYRSYQILGTIGGGVESDDPVARALRESMAQEVERIFRLLGLLHPRLDLESAFVGVQSDNPVIHDNSLEFLDNVFKPQLRQILVPLLDSTVTVAERILRANQLVGAKVESREEAVAEMLASEDPWLKSCGAYAIGTFGIKSLEHALDNCLEHPDPLLRETARQAKLRLALPQA